MPPSAPDPTRCPLCEQSNQCGMAAGASECWCYTATIPAEVLARVPEAARGVACVCRNCAEGRIDPALTQHELEELLRRRGA